MWHTNIHQYHVDSSSAVMLGFLKGIFNFHKPRSSDEIYGVVVMLKIKYPYLKGVLVEVKYARGYCNNVNC